MKGSRTGNILNAVFLFVIAGSRGGYEHKGNSFRGNEWLRQNVSEKEKTAGLMRLGEEADSSSLPEEMDIPQEMVRRESRLEVIRMAKKEIEARAKQRYERKLEEYREKKAKRGRYEEETGKKPVGREQQGETQQVAL